MELSVILISDRVREIWQKILARKTQMALMEHDKKESYYNYGAIMFRRIFGIGKRRTRSDKDSGSIKGSVVLEDHSCSPQTDSAVVPLHPASTAVKKKKEPAEVLNQAVDKLVEKLEGINDNLTQQVSQNQQLVQRMDVLPDMLSKIPKAVEQQQQAFARVAEQLEQKIQRDEQVAEELVGIHEKVSSAVQVSGQMSEKFGCFTESLAKLDQDTISQTDWLRQLSSSLSASERYFKYALEKQQKRFYWILGISLGVCLAAIVGLIIGIFYLV